MRRKHGYYRGPGTRIELTEILDVSSGYADFIDLLDALTELHSCSALITLDFDLTDVIIELHSSSALTAFDCEPSDAFWRPRRHGSPR